MSQSVVALLRNTYALINKYELDPLDPNLNSYRFIKGNDLPRYIKENNYKISDNDIISIIDTNINSIYWDNRELLSITDLENLTDYMKTPIIEFSKLDTDPSNIQIYSIDNSNIDYNMLFIKVKDFVKYINNNTSVPIKFPKINMNIELQYELYDFYNNTTNKIENFISR